MTAEELRLAVTLDRSAIGAAVGLTLDPPQARVLRSDDPGVLFVASRQVGKSTTAALLVLLTIVLQPGALVLIVAPTTRQARELFRKLKQYHRAAGGAVPGIVAETTTALEFAGGARVVVVAADEDTVRGYSSVALVVIDEAAFVPEPVYAALRPMLAVSGGRLVAISTPRGRRGWFFKAWSEDAEGWLRLRVRASECPRISPAYLATERRRMGDTWFAQEFDAEFMESTDAVFTQADIARALDPACVPFARAVA